jgi:hypothetical protein
MCEGTVDVLVTNNAGIDVFFWILGTTADMSTTMDQAIGLAIAFIKPVTIARIRETRKGRECFMDTLPSIGYYFR